MDDASAAFDREMRLTLAYAAKQNVACRLHSCGHAFEMVRKRLVQFAQMFAAQPVIPSHMCRIDLEDPQNEADAIETCLRIPTLRPKRQTNERPRPANDVFGFPDHAPGYRVSKSVPGRCGSPRKFTPF